MIKPSFRQRWAAYFRYFGKLFARGWHTLIMQPLKFENSYDTYINVDAYSWEQLKLANDPITWYVVVDDIYGRDRPDFIKETKRRAKEFAMRNPAWGYIMNPDNGMLVGEAEEVYYSELKGENVTLNTPPSNNLLHINYGKMLAWFLVDGKWYFLKARASKGKWFKGLAFWASQTHIGWYSAGRLVLEIKG